ncbi:endolytic transglycosylase MltG [Oceanivirga miroungae]|uniref:Endolytic murein transglycosylase n=1 Tax=Oceanivirga miroungae TaxID=1130046 RepID=A0A6I8M8I2_9FUSO|nr:endolytic transglycosylase MltG [Oceanivirga miroungae]VWL85824.1 aminodeoxychorismate lyase [Oceanivirga miroungae]
MKLIIKLFKYTIILCFVFFISGIYNITIKKQNVKGKKVFVSKNESISSIYKELSLNYGIEDKFYFYVTKEDRYIKSGNVEFFSNMSKQEILKSLKNPKFNNISLTIPEGFTSEKVIERIDSLGLANKKDMLKAMSGYDFYYPHNEIFEGYLYPDTYYFSSDESAYEILDKILKEFLEKYPPSKYDKNKFYDIIKIASIIEKEIDNDKEKKYISSVFHNRLNKNMMLQSDATLGYILDEKVSKKELLENTSLYNTYKYKGLPPSPISNPSSESIEASINPIKTNYLYFFTYNKKTYYSKTHKEHLKKRKESGHIK